MGHKLKQLGVSLVAVLALSLAITSIAAAANFTASSYPAVYEGNSNPSEYGSITTEAGTVECTSASTSATLSEASSTLSISGSATGCKAFGFSATINPNGCTALVHVGEETGTDTYKATGDLVCPEGKSVVTTAGACEVQVPPHVGGVTGQLTNETGNGTVKVELKNHNMKYNVTKDGFTCPFKGTGEKTGAVVHQLKAATVKIEGNSLHIG